MESKGLSFCSSQDSTRAVSPGSILPVSRSSFSKGEIS